MSVTVDAIREAKLSANENVHGNLRLLKQLKGRTNAEIAAGMGETDYWVQERLRQKKPTGVTASDVAAFAAFFEVPVSVLYEPPDQALKLLADLGFQPMCWMDDYAGQYGRAAGF